MQELHASWKDKISNPAQLGGIETAVLDNGAGRNTRIAWINTGTGLRYKLVLDRAMDIADAFYNQHSLTWLNNTGFAPPQPFADKGAGWLRTFGGGLLTTCGLSHVGGPESDAYGERGLHGLISNVPAAVESILQPDPLAGNLHMSITGTMHETKIFGPSLQLKRTISGILGKPSIFIHDEVTNKGNTTVPHMLLYHCNFGWPLADEGTEIFWQGNWQERFGAEDNRIFTNSNNFKNCPAPMDAHNGAGEDVAVIDIAANHEGKCSCGLYNRRLNLAAAIHFSKEQLPWLTNWQHWGKNEYVTGLEPGTNPPVGQAKAREQNQLIFLQPGESRTYDLEIEVLADYPHISQFVQGLTNAL